jgi:hypothetical protein
LKAALVPRRSVWATHSFHSWLFSPFGEDEEEEGGRGGEEEEEEEERRVSFRRVASASKAG